MAAHGQSAAMVAKTLSGIDFPAGRDQLVDHARRNHAADDMIEFLRGMPDTEYKTMADVFKGVSQAPKQKH